MGRKSRAKRERRKNSAPLPQPVTHRRILLNRIFLVAIAALVTGVAIAVTITRSASRGRIPGSTAPFVPVAYSVSPKTFDELLAVAPDDLAKVDIARMNLLCAEGLPSGEIDMDRCMATLDEWAAHVHGETERHLYKFRQQPQEYEDSEAYFRMLMLVTVLQQDLGVHYNMERVRDIDFTRSQDLFIHGMIDSDNGGTCVSIPVIYTAIAHRLGYPVKLVATNSHIFARWDGEKDPNPAYRDRFNIEGTNRGLGVYDDEHYMTWPKPITKQEAEANGWLRSLTPQQELAVFFATRGHSLTDLGRLDLAYAMYTKAQALHPCWLYSAFASDARRRIDPQFARATRSPIYAAPRTGDGLGLMSGGRVAYGPASEPILDNDPNRFRRAALEARRNTERLRAEFGRAPWDPYPIQYGPPPTTPPGGSQLGYPNAPGPSNAPSYQPPGISGFSNPTPNSGYQPYP